MFDAGPDQVGAILKALPGDAQKVQLRPDLLPVVAFTDGGKRRYAYAIGDLAVADSAPAGLTNAPGASSPPMVKVTVSAIASPAPGSATPRGKLIDLVSGAWPADVVVGRQVLLTFMPQQGPKACIESHLSALPMRIPATMPMISIGGTAEMSRIAGGTAGPG